MVISVHDMVENTTGNGKNVYIVLFVLSLFPTIFFKRAFLSGSLKVVVAW